MLSLKEKESLGIFYGLVASLSLMRCHGMSSITYDDCSTFDIGRQRVLIAELPKANIFCLP